MSVSSTESGNTKCTRLSSHTSSDKKVVLCRKYAEFSASRSSSAFPEKNWEKLTNDSFILELVKGYQIPFLSEPSQTTPPTLISMIQEKTVTMDQEIQEMLKKGAIKFVQPITKNQFLSSIFIVQKKESGYRLVINLKKLNKYIPYIHFKVEGLFVLKETLFKEDCMCKIDLKDV